MLENGECAKQDSSVLVEWHVISGGIKKPNRSLHIQCMAAFKEMGNGWAKLFCALFLLTKKSSNEQNFSTDFSTTAIASKRPL